MRDLTRPHPAPSSPWDHADSFARGRYSVAKIDIPSANPRQGSKTCPWDLQVHVPEKHGQDQKQEATPKQEQEATPKQQESRKQLGSEQVPGAVLRESHPSTGGQKRRISTGTPFLSRQEERPESVRSEAERGDSSRSAPLLADEQAPVILFLPGPDYAAQEYSAVLDMVASQGFYVVAPQMASDMASEIVEATSLAQWIEANLDTFLSSPMALPADLSKLSIAGPCPTCTSGITIYG